MKTRHIILSIAAALALASCDTLNKTPLAALSPDTFFETEAGMMAFSNQFYAAFPTSELYIENCDNYIQMTLSDEMRGARVIPASGSGWSWGALRNVNTLLDNLGQCQDAQVREKYEALARFFRAYFYYNKVVRFGDVPWYDTQIGSADNAQLNRPRDSREFIMQHIVDDLEFAATHLSSERSVYTVNRWTALALLSRACLFEGTFRKYHAIDGYEHNADWYLEKCAKASYEFITTSPYSIYSAGKKETNYLELFTTETIEGQDIACEVILARNFNRDYSVVHSSAYTTLVSSMGRPGMTKKMVASYLCKDGSRFTDKAGWQTMVFADEVKDRDPRLSQSIRTPGYQRIGGETFLAPDLSCAITGYHPIKYVTTSEKDAYNGSDIDLIIFRAAEVYLNYAEAKAELGTLTQDDLDLTIKKLRARVGMPALDLAAANANPDSFLCNKSWGGYQMVSGSNKGVILEIRRERGVELCQEGFRYNDILRWKEGKVFEQQHYGMYFPGAGEYDLDGNGTKDVCLYTGTKPSSTATLVLQLGVDIILSEGSKGYVNPHKNVICNWNEDRDYLYPIPTDERSLTMGALAQNPGWNDGLSF